MKTISWLIILLIVISLCTHKRINLIIILAIGLHKRISIWNRFILLSTTTSYCCVCCCSTHKRIAIICLTYWLLIHHSLVLLKSIWLLINVWLRLLGSEVETIIIRWLVAAVHLLLILRLGKTIVVPLVGVGWLVVLVWLVFHKRIALWSSSSGWNKLVNWTVVWLLTKLILLKLIGVSSSRLDLRLLLKTKSTLLALCILWKPIELNWCCKLL